MSFSKIELQQQIKVIDSLLSKPSVSVSNIRHDLTVLYSMLHSMLFSNIRTAALPTYDFTHVTACSSTTSAMETIPPSSDSPTDYNSFESTIASEHAVPLSPSEFSPLTTLSSSTTTTTPPPPTATITTTTTTSSSSRSSTNNNSNDIVIGDDNVTDLEGKQVVSITSTHIKNKNDNSTQIGDKLILTRPLEPSLNCLSSQTLSNQLNHSETIVSVPCIQSMRQQATDPFAGGSRILQPQNMYQSQTQSSQHYREAQLLIEPADENIPPSEQGPLNKSGKNAKKRQGKKQCSNSSSSNSNENPTAKKNKKKHTPTDDEQTTKQFPTITATKKDSKKPLPVELYLQHRLSPIQTPPTSPQQSLSSATAATTSSQHQLEQQQQQQPQTESELKKLLLSKPTKRNSKNTKTSKAITIRSKKKANQSDSVDLIPTTTTTTTSASGETTMDVNIENFMNTQLGFLKKHVKELPATAISSEDLLKLLNIPLPEENTCTHEFQKKSIQNRSGDELIGEEYICIKCNVKKENSI